MSGIAGIIRLDGSPVASAEVEAMLTPMARRGPDRRQSFCISNAGFGQALLATTPEALVETQPWVHPETGCVVVSDSRLDNRPELLRDLGITRPTDEVGDGELLHAAWQRWAEGCADRLRGDFAFAIWDARIRRLFCARDIMGVRPLYFHHAPGKLFAFASDTDSLLALADVPRRINEGRIADALMQDLEGIDRTSTFYLDIQRLPPARWLKIEMDQLSQAEYWQPICKQLHALPQTDLEWTEAIREALDHAVRCRLRSNDRVGSMVSGGLDSSSVAALGQSTLDSTSGTRLPTFSVVDSSGPCKETDAIRAMLRSFDFDATCIDVHSMQQAIPILHAQLDAMREPFDGTMPLISTVYATASRMNVRCLIDGMPADNLYTVGNYFRGLAGKGQWRKLWHEARAVHETSGYRMPALRAVQTLLGSIAPARLHKPWEAWREWNLLKTLYNDSCISPAFAARNNLIGRFRTYRLDMRSSRLGDSEDVPQTVMTAAYITAAVERYNRVASFFGVEPRHPFVDRTVVELHAWLPLSLRLRNGHYKWALRKAMVDILPTSVTWRTDKSHIGVKFNARLLESWPTPIEPNQGQNSARLDAAEPRALLAARKAYPKNDGVDWVPMITSVWLQKHMP